MGQVQCRGFVALGAALPFSFQPCSSRSWRKDTEGPASLAPPGSLEPSKKALKIHSLQGLVCYNLFSCESRDAFPTWSLPAGGDEKEKNPHLQCLPWCKVSRGAGRAGGGWSFLRAAPGPHRQQHQQKALLSTPLQPPCSACRLALPSLLTRRRLANTAGPPSFSSCLSLQGCASDVPQEPPGMEVGESRAIRAKSNEARGLSCLSILIEMGFPSSSPPPCPPTRSGSVKGTRLTALLAGCCTLYIPDQLHTIKCQDMQGFFLRALCSERFMESSITVW